MGCPSSRYTVPAASSCRVKEMSAPRIGGAGTRRGADATAGSAMASTGMAPAAASKVRRVSSLRMTPLS